MKRRTVFAEYKPKKILNRHKHTDHWFWARYSAHPYIGCQHGCEFCYCRETKYSPYDDPADFAYSIKVKENAADLLRKELSRSAVDLVFTGDYQPAERKFGISRQMLETFRDFGFQVFVLERSQLVLRDLGLLEEINLAAPSVVAFSCISTPDSKNYETVRRIEHLAPPSEKRFAAMEKIAGTGILTGTCFMPILPGICDDEDNLEAVIRWTAEHGGKFVLASSLTLADQQKSYFFNSLSKCFPQLMCTYQKLYPTTSYGPAYYDWQQIARQIREMCTAYGISDRMPRPIIPGDKFGLNKRITELLANKAYDLELQQEPENRIWAYRRAAWAVEDLEQDIGLIRHRMGLKGLQDIPEVGVSLGEEIEKMLSKQQPSGM